MISREGVQIGVDYWEKYNSKMSQSLPASVTDTETQMQFAVTSYTHHFLEDYNLDAFFNLTSKKILQLGAADGRFIKEKHRNGWDVMAYDYSVKSISVLQGKGINVKNIDLNAISHERGALSYVEELKKDLSEPVNVLM